MSGQRPHILVVGAGPAGLFAAETAAMRGARVTVVDRMAAPARKFLLAGRGGLNLTHSEPLARFVGRYTTGGDYGRTVIADTIETFTPEQLVAWANGFGQPTFVGSSGRVFPKAMKASPLLRAWLRRLADHDVTFNTRHVWTGFGDRQTLIFSNDVHSHVPISADAAVLALGGASWPRLGSDGSWVAAMAAEGLSVTPLQPSNCGVEVPWSSVFAEKHAGRPLKRISLFVDGMGDGAADGQRGFRGEAVVTRRGLEGGAVYAAGHAIRSQLSKVGAAMLHVDLKPDMSIDDVAARLSRPRAGQSLSNHLRKTLSLDPAAIGMIREGAELPNDDFALAHRIKAVPLTILGLASINRAISTAGGLSFGNLDRRLMLRGKPGIFVAGEMLDWDAPTGGYLLQGCFATGFAAGNGAVDWAVETSSQATTVAG